MEYTRTERAALARRALLQKCVGTSEKPNTSHLQEKWLLGTQEGQEYCMSRMALQ